MTPEETTALVQAVVANAKRLGLVWTLTTATVKDGSDPGAVIATSDGPGGVAMPMYSMCGRIDPEARVYVITIPPAGNYIVGPIGESIGGRGIIADAYWISGATAGSTGTEVAAGAWNAAVDPVFENDRLYQLDFDFGITTNSAAVTAQQVRIRKGTTPTITGQQLLFFQDLIAAGSSGFALSRNARAFVKNVTGADISTPVVPTCQRSLGAGTSSIFGDANIPLQLTITDVGHVDDPRLVAQVLVATSIT